MDPGAKRLFEGPTSPKGPWGPFFERKTIRRRLWHFVGPIGSIGSKSIGSIGQTAQGWEKSIGSIGQGWLIDCRVTRMRVGKERN